MSYEAKVLSILIASPSDVQEEREIAVKTIQEWNELHSSSKQIVLLPIRWETHTTPEYGSRPQEIINKQIVDDCDILIGIFWTKLGSPTGVADSGTLEEIDRVALLNKPIMLYFSRASMDPDQIDTEQLTKLREFKAKTYKNALVENFNNQIDFKDKLSKQIERQVLKIRSSEGGASDSMQSNILLEFFDIESKQRLGVSHRHNGVYFNVNDANEIPDYFIEKSSEDKKSNKSIIVSYRDFNRDYIREMIAYEVMNLSYIPINFWMKNIGSLGAKDLYIVIDIKSKNQEIDIISLKKIRKKPKKNKNSYMDLVLSYSGEEYLNIEKLDSKNWRLIFEIPALQPKREIDIEEPIFLGSKSSCQIDFFAKIYADSLPDPISYNLNLDLNIEIENISYKDITIEELEDNE